MHVTNVRVSFLREKQPAQYEKAAPAVEFVATLDDGEDHQSAARHLMSDAATIVYAGIGYAVPDKVAAALLGGNVPAGLSVTAETVEASPEAPEEVAEATEDKPKARGRPKGSKNTMPKKETAKAKREREEREAAEAEAVPGDDDAVPGDDDAVPGDDAISTGEARVGPDDDPSDHDAVPGDDAPAAEGEFTPKDLHTLITGMIGAKKLSIPNAKQVLAKFKVARAQDLTMDQALEGKAMVEQMVAAAEVQKKA